MNTEKHYREVYQSFIEDGMSYEWAKLEVSGRVLQDANVGQFNQVVDMLNKIKGWG